MIQERILIFNIYIHVKKKSRNHSYQISKYRTFYLKNKNYDKMKEAMAKDKSLFGT